MNDSDDNFCKLCGNNFNEDKTATSNLENAINTLTENPKPICSKCKQENKIGTKFCRNCGNRMNTNAIISDTLVNTPTDNTCQNCKTVNNIGTRLCKSCGNIIRKSSTNTPIESARPFPQKFVKSSSEESNSPITPTKNVVNKKVPTPTNMTISKFFKII